MNQKLISIVIPIHNVAPYLEKCLNSILAQSYSTYEVILVNDASTDESGIICDKYQEKDPRIKVIHKKQNEGVAEARNTGLFHAKGEYVCYIDPDDYVEDTYLEILYSNAVTYNADISYCHYERVYGDKADNELCKENIIHQHSKGDLWDKLSTGKGRTRLELVVVWNKLIRKEIVDMISFPAGKWHEDEYYINYLLERANSFVETEAQLYNYRQRPNSIISDETRLDLRHLDALDAYEERIHICRNFTTEKTYKQMIISYRERIILRYQIFNKGQVARNLKIRLLKSYVQYGHIGLRQLGRHLLFFIVPKFYYKKYWGS